MRAKNGKGSKHGASNSKRSKNTLPPKPKSNDRSKSWEDKESRDMRRDFRRRLQKEDASSLNDFSWYNKYPVLSEGAGRIQFPYRPGMEINFLTQNLNIDDHYSVPGVMVMDWAPSFGISNSNQSSLNLAAREIWARVREAFSGTLDVDPPDFIMYIAALDSLYSYIAYLKRIYELIDWYSANNFVTPNGLLAAMGMTDSLIKDLRDNKADFNLGINYLIRKSRKYVMPFNMDLLVRHYWMSKNVYTDAATINSQFYLFNLVGLYQYDLLPSPNDPNIKASGCKYVKIGLPGLTSYQQLLAVGDTLLEAMAAHEDTYIMNGYLQRAYGSDAGFIIDEVPIHASFEAAFTPEVLAQIENSSTLFSSRDRNVTGLSLVQDPATNIVYYEPKLPSVSDPDGYTLFATISDKSTLSIRDDAPSVEQVFVASRLKTVLAAGDYVLCGTELSFAWTIYYFNHKQQKWVTASYGTRVSNGISGVDVFKSDAIASSFDWRPIQLFVENVGSGEKVHLETIISGDVHNITALPNVQLEQLHRVALLSELNVFGQA